MFDTGDNQKKGDYFKNRFIYALDEPIFIFRNHHRYTYFFFQTIDIVA